MNIESNFQHISTLKTPLDVGKLTLKNELQSIFEHRLVTPLFQPIIDLPKRKIFAHEALIRGPIGSSLHNPLKLFEAADQCGMLFEMDWLARSVAINEFQHQQADDFLFINVTVNSLLTENHRQGMTLDCLENSGLPLNRVVIEITELQPVHNFKLFIDSVNHYRQMGFKVALDDLGGGYNGLRLWSELRPDFVKIDKHFITGISQDTEKRHFLQTIKVLAEGLDTQLIAEGIETLEDLKVVEQIGIDFVQGYFFRRPEKIISDQLYYKWQYHSIQPKLVKLNLTDLSALLLAIESIESTTSVQQVANLFLNQQELDFIAVVDDGKVQGMIWRRELMDKLARRYGQELHHRKSIAYLMDSAPIIVDVTTPVENLSRQITDGNHHQNGDAFIITQNGNYLGCGRFIDLLRLITDLKVQNAQYANPLSGLPGNVPIQRHMQERLDLRQGFSVIYVDADHFKPYNDFYSYDQGDEIIKQISKILRAACEKTQSFIGHIGGDDFMIIIQNIEDYKEICQIILDQFNHIIKDFYHPEDQAQGGIMSANRQGHVDFFPMMSLSLGVLVVPPGLVAHKQKIAGLATKAKKQAKQAGGNTWSVIKAEQDNLPAIQNSKNGVK